MAPPTPQQTTPLTPPSTPPTPKPAHLNPLPGPPLRLPLPPSSSQPKLPRITITLNNRPMPPLPWRPCQPTKPQYDGTSLAPPRRSELIQRRQQQQQQQQQHQAETPFVPEVQEAPEDPEPLLLLSASLLRPIARELVRWRLLTFYKLSTAAAATEEAKARANILAAGIDWQRTWDLLRCQRARYLARERRSLGLLLLERCALRGLHVLRAVHRAAVSAGVGSEQVGLAVEAFAKREGGEGDSVSVSGSVVRKEWDVLAGCLLMDRGLQGREREVLFPSSQSAREGLWDEICVKREKAVKQYFSVLEYEERCAGYCCFAGSDCGKRKVVYRLCRRENARLDGTLELQRQLLRAPSASRSASGQRERQSESESDNREEGGRENARQAKAQKKHVRISADVDEAQQNSESASRASWNSEEERQKRRKERREFIFGKEDGDQGEDEEAEEEEEQRNEQERKRRQSLERVTAANAKWNQDYADC